MLDFRVNMYEYVWWNVINILLLHTMSSFFLSFFCVLFFLQINSTTPATIITKPPIATRGITVKGTSFVKVSSRGTEVLFLSLLSISLSTLGMSSGVFGGLNVGIIVVVSGTVVSIACWYISLVVLWVVLVKFGWKGSCWYPGNLIGGGWGSLGLWPDLSVTVAYTSVFWGMEPSYAVTHSEYDFFSWKYKTIN